MIEPHIWGVKGEKPPAAPRGSRAGARPGCTQEKGRARQESRVGRSAACPASSGGLLKIGQGVSRGDPPLFVGVEDPRDLVADEVLHMDGFVVARP